MKFRKRNKKKGSIKRELKQIFSNEESCVKISKKKIKIFNLGIAGIIIVSDSNYKNGNLFFIKKWDIFQFGGKKSNYFPK